jgi:hypothetical protein
MGRRLGQHSDAGLGDNGHVHLTLLRRQEDRAAVDGLNCQRKARFFLDVSGESFVIFVRCPFFPHIERVHQGVQQIVPTALRDFFRYQKCFPVDSPALGERGRSGPENNGSLMVVIVASSQV